MKFKKDFDCVEMKQAAQNKIQKEVHGFTIEEKVRYWKSVSIKMQHKYPGLKLLSHIK